MKYRMSKRASSKWLIVSFVGMAVTVSAPNVSAQTMYETLAKAYQSNPTLQAQRAELRSIDEGVPQAKSKWRPDLQFTSKLNKLQRRTNNIGGGLGAGNDTRTTYNGRFTLTQNVYEGGRTVAEISQAKHEISRERARLVVVEQQVLMDAVTAYMNVVRDQAVLQLNIGNEQVLVRQLEATKDRFDVGEVTRTDVAQAESRYARTTAERIQSEGDLEVSRAFYEQIVGENPVKVSQPDYPDNLPTSEADAVKLSSEKNPSVIVAIFNERASRDSIEAAKSDLLPNINLVADARRGRDEGSSDRTISDITLSAELTVPIYQQGGVSSNIREAQQLASRNLIRVEEARRSAIEAGSGGWEKLLTARASIKSREAAVRAARIALEGVQQEAAVGSRTVLDVLDAEQELLDAQVSLVRDQRDATVASYYLLSAAGRLTARDLALPVKLYNFETNYKKVRDQMWGYEGQLFKW
jgi:outer membrane protein